MLRFYKHRHDLGNIVMHNTHVAFVQPVRINQGIIVKQRHHRRSYDGIQICFWKKLDKGIPSIQSQLHRPVMNTFLYATERIAKIHAQRGRVQEILQFPVCLGDFCFNNDSWNSFRVIKLRVKHDI